MYGFRALGFRVSGLGLCLGWHCSEVQAGTCVLDQGSLFEGLFKIIRYEWTSF